ncbi:hypothetical protein [Ligilactobacillus equi]
MEDFLKKLADKLISIFEKRVELHTRDYMRLKQAADYCCMCENSFNELVRENVDVIKVGGVKMWSKEDLKNFLESNRVK